MSPLAQTMQLVPHGAESVTGTSVTGMPDLARPAVQKAGLGALAVAIAAGIAVCTPHVSRGLATRSSPRPPTSSSLGSPATTSLGPLVPDVRCNSMQNSVFDDTRVGGRVEAFCSLHERWEGGLTGMLLLTQFEPKECAPYADLDYGQVQLVECSESPADALCKFNASRCMFRMPNVRPSCPVFCKFDFSEFVPVRPWEPARYEYDADHYFEDDGPYDELKVETENEQFLVDPFLSSLYVNISQNACLKAPVVDFSHNSTLHGKPMATCPTVSHADADQARVTRLPDIDCDLYRSTVKNNPKLSLDCLDANVPNGHLCEIKRASCPEAYQLPGSCPVFCKAAERWHNGPQ